MKIAMLLMICVCAAAAAALAETVRIPANADTTLKESLPANNFGGRLTLRAGSTTTRNRALLSFNVAGAVPPGAIILGARFTMTATDAPSVPGTIQEFELRRVLRAWNEGAQSGAQGGAAEPNDATWDHRLSPHVPWITSGGAAGSDFAATASAEFVVENPGVCHVESTAQLVADTQTWLDTPESNFGWALLGKSEAVPQTARLFAAREDSVQAPTLEIDFTMETPDFRVTGISLSNGQATLNWAGGRPPFQVFTRPTLASGAWTATSPLTAANSATINTSGSQGFLQVTCEPTAEYDVVFSATWSAATHPTDFPGSAHWSGLVGGLHDNRAEFWRPGATASVGMQNMAELGAKTQLLTEVTTAIAAGTANRMLSGGGISGGSGSVTLRFQVDRTHPLVTLVTMVAPSPDWFAGVRGLPLIENGEWVQSKTVALYPWDTGTDSGTTFNSVNQVTSPRGVITRIVTPPLAADGYAPPMGTFTFTRVRIVPAP
jgi:hypothetical protein